MSGRQFDINGDENGVVGHLLAGGEMLPAQLPSASNWSPEKKLAAAVLAGALVEIRERRGDPNYARKITQDIEWVFADDTRWPYAFVPLCEFFGLEPEYVRNVVRRWLQTPAGRTPRQSSTHRHAA